MFVCLTVSDLAMSKAKVREDEDVQKPIYYVIKSFLDAEIRYQMEKLALAFLITSRKPKHYFQSFQIIVLIMFRLKSVLENPQAIGNISKWFTELEGHHIEYKPITTIEGQKLQLSSSPISP